MRDQRHSAGLNHAMVNVTIVALYGAESDFGVPTPHFMRIRESEAGEKAADGSRSV